MSLLAPSQISALRPQRLGNATQVLQATRHHQERDEELRTQHGDIFTTVDLESACAAFGAHLEATGVRILDKPLAMSLSAP